MARAADACSDAGMDEPTLDCSICGRPAILEYRLDTLDDTANWRRTRTWLACVEHQDHYDVRAAWLATTDRMTIQRCG